MIFKRNHLAGIKNGTISAAFRKWKKPAVKIGTKLKTAIGLVEIVNVETVAENKIIRKDAASAGFDTVESLLDTWQEMSDGQIYKIALRYYSADPRIALRSQNELTDSDLETLKKKLEKLDRLSKTGPWTSAVLNAINDHPGLRAGDLAKSLGMEKLPFKIKVRKLKNLGLTISEEVGYTISPLGKWILKKIKP